MTNSKMKAGALLAAITVGISTFAAPAQAKPKFYPKPYGYHAKHHYGYGAPLAAGIAGALALGAVAASAAGGSDCYLEERERVDAYGNIVIRRVQVCE